LESDSVNEVNLYPLLVIRMGRWLTDSHGATPLLLGLSVGLGGSILVYLLLLFLFVLLSRRAAAEDVSALKGCLKNDTSDLVRALTPCMSRAP